MVPPALLPFATRAALEAHFVKDQLPISQRTNATEVVNPPSEGPEEVSVEFGGLCKGTSILPERSAG